MTTINTKSIKTSSVRKQIAKSGHLADKTIQRWIRFIEANSLDWLRYCPDGKTTPRHLHPYQAWLLQRVLEHKSVGKAWLAPELLRGKRWGPAQWLKETQNQQVS